MRTCLALLVFTLFIFPRTLIAKPESSFPYLENFVHPAQASLVSSAFGARNHPVLSGVKHHSGIDLPSPEGSPVRALSKGIVIKTGTEVGYGNLVIVLHEGGLTTLYAHLRDFRVQVGQAIKGGEILGRVGSTGRVTGPHLHFEVRKDGEALDPLLMLPFLDAKAKGQAHPYKDLHELQSTFRVQRSLDLAYLTGQMTLIKFPAPLQIDEIPDAVRQASRAVMKRHGVKI